MTFGERTEIVLKDQGMTQKRLAEQLHLSTSAVSAYLSEQRGVPKEVLADICRILNVSSDYLLGLTEDREPTITLQEGERELVMAVRTLLPHEQRTVYNAAVNLTQKD